MGSKVCEEVGYKWRNDYFWFIFGILFESSKLSNILFSQATR